ncbi:MAG: hypothetical protein ACE5HC_03150 [Candidatus Binatia bacterium]
MGKLIKNFLQSFLLLAFLSLLPQGAMAQVQDAGTKIKRLEALEARVDAKLKKLEKLEARIEARLAARPQLVSTGRGTIVASTRDGHNGMPLAVPSALVSASIPGRDKKLWGGQVSFRSGYTHLDGPAKSAFNTNGGKDGWMVGAALDIPLLKDPWFNNTLVGQISMDFSGMRNKTSGILGLSSNGSQNLYKIAVSPKYRFDNLGEVAPWLRNVRPYLIPVGLAFQVNSPPSNGVTYLTVGGTSGAGVEYVLARQFSLGVAFSFNYFNKDRNQINVNNLQVGPYVGINF